MRRRSLKWRAVLVLALVPVLSSDLMPSDAMDYVIALEKQKNDEQIARLQHENALKTSIIYSLAIVIAGGLIGYGLYRGLREREKRPNKAPEPTTTAVTSPAAQEPRQP
jgi:hypothetical protein